MSWKIKFRWPFRSLFYVERSVPTKIVYAQPDPAVFTKFFSVNKAFLPNPKGVPHVDWKNWTEVIDEYERRILVWYFNPVSENPVVNSLGKFDPAYPLMFTLCAFIDLLTQFKFDLDWHSPKQYEHFLRQHIPEFSRPLPRPIAHTTYSAKRGRWELGTLKNRAEVFYVGIRCSLLHHGDLASFCGMMALPNVAGKPVLLKECANAGMSLCGNYPYDLVVFNPYELKNRLLTIFKKYCDDLRANPSSKLSISFKRKMHQDYGIKI